MHYLARENAEINLLIRYQVLKICLIFQPGKILICGQTLIINEFLNNE